LKRRPRGSDGRQDSSDPRFNAFRGRGSRRQMRRET
jgi:hypothetical protein